MTSLNKHLEILKFGQESQKSDTSLNIYSTIQQLEDLIQKNQGI